MVYGTVTCRMPLWTGVPRVTFRSGSPNPLPSSSAVDSTERQAHPAARSGSESGPAAKSGPQPTGTACMHTRAWFWSSHSTTTRLSGCALFCTQTVKAPGSGSPIGIGPPAAGVHSTDAGKLAACVHPDGADAARIWVAGVYALTRTW
jgi:hypothetical protein